MNSKFKKVLSYIGVGLLGSLIGIGALIGVSSCSNNSDHAETTPLKSVAIKKQAIISSSNRESVLNSDKIYYARAKNYQDNGNGTFYYEGVIDLAHSTSFSGANDSIGYFRGTFDLITGNAIQKTGLSITTQLYGGFLKLNEVYLWGGDNSTFYYVYSAPNGSFNRQYCGFTFTNLRYADDYLNSQRLDFFFSLFTIYELQDDYYEFASNINYYSPYGQDISSFYVNDSNMTSPSSYSVKTLLEKTPFLSGGYVFDTIRLRYQNAVATYYKDDSGNKQLWGVNGFASFSWVEYVNSATNLILVVNERIYEPWNSGSNSGYIVTKGSKWISTYFQKIQFFVNVSDITITNLSKLNNSSYSGGYIANQQNTDVGLGNVFELLSLAFASWIPILSIQIVPGITIGLLMFLPLISGIIVLVIWIVKR